MTTNRKSQTTLSIIERRKLARLIEAHGLRPLAKIIGVHAQTLASAAAGIGTNRSTTALLQRRLAEIDSEEGARR